MYNRSIYSYILAFFIPFLCIATVFLLFGVYPFGVHTILFKDMYGQYIQFFYQYYDMFRGDKNLFYSWEAGLGTNFLGLFGYYLSSLFNPVILLFDRSYLPEAIALLVMLKVGFMGLTMFLYCRWSLKSSSIEGLIFSTAYALMSYVLIYFQNIMWMDALIYLPLILIGVDRLIQSRRVTLLTISLALLFISNFYMAFMVGLFVFFYFVIKVIQANDHRLKQAFVSFFLFVMCTLIAAGLSAFIIVPTYLSLGETANEIVPDTSFYSLFPLTQFLSKLYFGSYDSIVDGLPNVYAGLLPLLLASVFFWIKNISLKEKLLFGSLMLILIASFQISTLNLVWHAFDQPNLFPFRYSFLFSFVILYVAIRAYQHVQKQEVPWLAAMYVLLVGAAIWVQKMKLELMTERALYINIALLSLGLFLLLLKVYLPKLKAVVSILVLGFVMFDMTANAYLVIRYVSVEAPPPGRTEFSEGRKLRSIFNELEDYDTTLFRAEGDGLFSMNEPFRYGYKGMKHFSSMIDMETVQSMETLGYTTYNNKWVSNKGGTLFTDALLGQKYYVSEKEELSRYGYTKVNELQHDGYRVFRNQFSLPIGYVVNDLPQEVDSDRNRFEEQNKLIRTMVDSNRATYFNKLPIKSITYENAELRKSKDADMLVKLEQGIDAKIEYTFQVMGEQQLYLYSQSSSDRTFTIFINGHEVGVYPETYNKGIFNLGLFKNEEVTVTLRLDTAFYEFTDMLWYGLDIAQYSQAISQLQKSPLEITDWTSRTLKGNSKAEQKGWLFVSIPYDRGWTIEVDGKRVEPSIALGGFTAIPVNGGNHQLSMSYISPGFVPGLVISLGSLLLFVVFRYIVKKRLVQ
ncbi:YfhO family protein [Bacillus salitolerans]|uniref:YfhO family protein n=1 Tax=Bacillus salitolerans TaxID=1437434 RepID=A0ABW4LQN1_9BACI